jgi:hypothetical protein
VTTASLEKNAPMSHRTWPVPSVSAIKAIGAAQIASHTAMVASVAAATRRRDVRASSGGGGFSLPSQSGCRV